MDLSEVPSEVRLRHPWETSRFRFLHGVLRRIQVDEIPRRVLDVGAGDGWFSLQLLARMPSGSRAACVDAAYEERDVAALTAAGRGRVEALARRPDAKFDLVLLLDVLEHVEDDAGLLAAVVRENLADGGFVLATVPAWSALYCRRDAALRHFRRYSPARFHALLRGAGLARIASGGAFHSGVAPRAAAVAVERVRGRRAADGETDRHELRWDHGPAVTRVAETALAVDNFVSATAAAVRLPLPGLTAWALCGR
jgi:2-polyprenyl-3-methyl-5-hydroxy-6-metoxy-1,4-benzoquinol methylase